ncbi:MAG: TetR family transcriptional regulator C-terminal domain-containing protein, partial [[Mycobacterium] stephanolepidis]
LAGLMHYFPTRDVILTEIQRGADATFEERYQNSMSEVDPGEVLAQAMLDKASKPGSGTVYLSLAAAAAVDPGHPAGAYLRDRYERMRAHIAEYVRGRQAGGTVPAHVDADFVATALIAAADGIQIQWMSDPSIDMGRHMRRVWEQLLS